MDIGKKIQSEPTEKEMIDIRRQCGKCLYDIFFPTESPDFDSIEESYEEAITRTPSLEGRLA